MDNSTIFTKTAKGLGETGGKTRALPRHLRSVLKEIDGDATLEELQQKLGKPELELHEALSKLCAGDYIREYVPQGTSANDADFGLTLTGTIEEAGEASVEYLQEVIRLDLEARKKEERERNTKEEQEVRREAEEKARLEAEELARQKAVETARRKAEEHARREAEEKVRKEAEERTRREAEVRAKKEAEERARQEAELAARRKAEEQAKRKAEEKAQKEAAEKARLEAEARAKKEAEERARQEAELLARRKAEEKARKDAAEHARREAEEKAKKDAEERARQKAELLARRKAEEKARKEAAEKARLEAEAQAKKEAEERARQEAELLARRKAEEEAKKEAAEKARREAEAQARKEAEERARQEAERLAREAEDKARKEAEEKARLEAEARARKEAEERARQEAELLARQKAEEEARREAAEKARLEAEALAKKEAEERARQEAELLARREAEDKARKEEEERARREAEARAKKEAEERARLEAEQLAREAEEKAKREAAEKARREAEAQAKKEAKERARQEAELLARRKAEEKAAREAEKKLKKEAAEQAQREAEEHRRKEAAERALRKAEERSRREAEKQARREEDRIGREIDERLIEEEAEIARRQARTRAPAMSIGMPTGWGKRLAKGLFLLMLAGVGALHVVPFDDTARLIEKSATEQFQQPVKIDKVYLSLLPQPHWRLENVSVGKEGQIRVPKVNAVIEPGSLFSDRTAFSSIELTAPVLSEEGLGWLVFGRSKEQGVKVERLSATNVRVDSRALNLFPFDARVDIGQDGSWQKMVLDSTVNKMHAELLPDGEAVQVALNADLFKVPFGSALTLAKFNASGKLHRDEFALTTFSGYIYDGFVTGNGVLKWDKVWTLQGDLEAKAIDVAQIVPALLQRGKLESQMKYSLQAQESDRLFTAPRLEGKFAVHDGVLLGIDLANLLKNKNSGSNFVFTHLDGVFSHDKGKTKLSRMALDAGMVSAAGSAEMDAERNLGGRVAVELNSSMLQMRSSLSVSGKLHEPRFKRSG